MPKKIYPWEFWAIPKFIAAIPKLKDEDKMILGVFVTRHNGENPIPAKIETLHEQLGMPEIKIRRSLARLKKMKLITSKRMGNKRANQYDLDFKKLMKM